MTWKIFLDFYVTKNLIISNDKYILYIKDFLFLYKYFIFYWLKKESIIYIFFSKMIKKINGYRIFMNKKLGKGAYGVVIYWIIKVYEGEQSNTELPCAVKVLEKANSKKFIKFS